MGHGYFAVLAYGVLINIDLILEHKQLDSLSFGEVYNIFYEELNKTYPTLNFHFEQQYDADNVFITVGEKQIIDDARGACGRLQIVDLDELKLNKDELLTLESMQKELTGETNIQPTLSMYFYEGS